MESRAQAGRAATAAPNVAARADDPDADEPGPLATLRRLRSRLAGGAPPALAEVSALLERELPAGWARRRALAALFEAGLPPRAEDALALVGQLDSAADRRWALADLAASRRWSDGDFERLVAAADTPAVRRRLGNRRLAS
jgi:hypothetical protein